MSPAPRSPIARRTTTLAALGAATLLAALAVQGPAEATVAKAARPAPDVVMNTIDPVAIRARDGLRVRVTGPIGCDGGKITVVVRIGQASTDASAGGQWRGRCSGRVQHWVVRTRASDRTRFADGRARVHASALGGRHRWSAPVEVLTSGFDG